MQEKLVSGEMTISAAYQTIKKSRPNKKKGEATSDTTTGTGRDTTGQGQETAKTDSCNGAAASASGQASAGQTDEDATAQEEGAEQEQKAGDDKGHDDSARGEAEAGEDEGEEPEDTSSESSSTTPKEALDVILEFFSTCEPAQAQKIMQNLAAKAGVNCLFPPEDAAECLDELSGFVCEQLDRLAGDDYEAANNWVTRHKEDLRETMYQHTPDDGVDLGWQEPD